MGKNVEFTAEELRNAFRRELPDDGLGILNVALQLGKICRFAGATRTYWPVLMHSIAVASLAPKGVEIHALLHDVGEIFTGDVPAPFKPESLSKIEEQARRFVYEQLGVAPLVPGEEWTIIKDADLRVLRGEVWTIGPRALREHPMFERRDRDAEELIGSYLDKYTFMSVLSPTGMYIQRFVAWFYKLLINA